MKSQGLTERSRENNYYGGGDAGYNHHDGT